MELMTRILMITAACVLASLGATQLCMAADMAAPALVKSSLVRFAHDDEDMVRRVDAKEYERLAKEESDFVKDAELLRAAIRSEPAALQHAMETRIQQVLAASHDVVVAGRGHMDTRLRRALDALAEAVRRLNAEFPENL